MAPQSFLSSIVHALEADPKWKFDFSFQPLFPKASTVIVARKLLKDVMDAHRSPESAARQSPVIDVKAAYALYETIAQTASLLAEVINASSLPANRLPAEILSTIFSLVPRAYKHPSSTSDFPNRSSAFTRADDLQSITGVCRYWRQVALGTPSLWSTVAECPPTESKVWCQAPFWRYYAHRCTDGPLYVDMNARGSEETRALVSRHRDRVRELSVTFDSERDLGDANYFVALSTPFPNVEHCEIALAPTSRPFLNKPTTGVTSRCLPGSWRSLRCLVLANVPFIPSNSFPSLTSFTFSSREPEPSWTLRWYAQDIWNNLLKLLSRCRALVTVTLDGMGVLPSDVQLITWAPFPERIKLPHLKELALHDRCQWRDDRAGAYSQMYGSSDDVQREYRIGVPRAIHMPPNCRISIGVVHAPDLEELYAALLNLGAGTGPSIARVAFLAEVETGLRLLSVDTANLDSPGKPERTHVDIETVYSYSTPSSAPAPAPVNLTLTIAHRPTISSLPFFARLRELWIDADAHAAFMRVDSDLAPCALLNLAELAQLETLVVRRASVRESDHTDASVGTRLPAEGGGWEDRPGLATARDVLKSLEPQAATGSAADPTGNEIAGALACPCPFLATLRVDVIGPSESDEGVDGADADEAGYVRGLAVGRAAAGCPISRLLIGVVFRDDVTVSPKAYVVWQYDAEGRLAVTGHHEADGLAERWRKGLSHM